MSSTTEVHRTMEENRVKGLRVTRNLESFMDVVEFKQSFKEWTELQQRLAEGRSGKTQRKTFKWLKTMINNIVELSHRPLSATK